MTADDIIRANPEYRYEPATIGGMAGLKGTHPDSGREWWCVYSSTSHVSAPGPWSKDGIRSAAACLAGSERYVDRRHYLSKPDAP